jgi:hypothetical protein
MLLYSGTRLCGFLWLSLNALSFFGWFLEMLSLSRKGCAYGGMKVLAYVFSAMAGRRTRNTCFLAAVSVGVFGETLWLIVCSLTRLWNGIQLLVGLLQP